jgi:hypothetical protein
MSLDGDQGDETTLAAQVGIAFVAALGTALWLWLLASLVEWALR